MKKIFHLLFLILLPLASAQVIYDIEAKQEEVRINSSIVLKCDEEDENCPVNSWRLSWDLPENAEIISLRDSQGEIEEYSLEGSTLELTTNTGPRRTSEKIDVEMRVDENAEEFGTLYRREVSLPGFSEKSNSGTLRAESLLSATVSSDFSKSFGDDNVNFSGQGASNIQVNFGEGLERGDYVFFSGEVQNASLAYRIAAGTTGLRQDFPRIPVRVLEDAEYEREGSEWSGGEYTSGLIRIRQNPDENQVAVLAEETVHAFNDNALSFDKTSSSWLDEGIAGYTQSMVRMKLVGEGREREVFGKDVSYTEERGGDIYRVTKPSKGEKEALWKYYQEDRKFMESWSPESGRRDFGYAYSELIVRNWVSRKNSVREIYSQIGDRKLESNEEKWSYYSGFMDLTPCEFESRERFENCLERINDYDYPVLAAQNLPEKKGDDVMVEELEVPEQDRYRNQELFSQGLVSSIIEFLKDLGINL
jgi:hypothetical protein